MSDLQEPSREEMEGLLTPPPTEMPPYTPASWYWVVGEGDDQKIWSSVSGAEIAADDADYVAWKGRGNKPSRIDTHDNLLDVLVSAAPESARQLAQAKFPDLVDEVNAVVDAVRGRAIGRAGRTR